MALLVSRQESMASGICAGSEPWCLQLRRGTEEKCSNSFVRRGVTAKQGEIFIKTPILQVDVYLARDAHISVDGETLCSITFVAVTCSRFGCVYAVEL